MRVAELDEATTHRDIARLLSATEAEDSLPTRMRWLAQFVHWAGSEDRLRSTLVELQGNRALRRKFGITLASIIADVGVVDLNVLVGFVLFRVGRTAGNVNAVDQ